MDIVRFIECNYGKRISRTATSFIFAVAWQMVPMCGCFNSCLTCEMLGSRYNYIMSFRVRNNQTGGMKLLKDGIILPDHANSIEYISKTYQKGCMLKRNRRLVESAGVLLTVYNGEWRGGTAATIQYTYTEIWA